MAGSLSVLALNPCNASAISIVLFSTLVDWRRLLRPPAASFRVVSSPQLAYNISSIAAMRARELPHRRRRTKCVGNGVGCAGSACVKKKWGRVGKGKVKLSFGCVNDRVGPPSKYDAALFTGYVRNSNNLIGRTIRSIDGDYVTFVSLIVLPHTDNAICFSMFFGQYML